MINLRKTPRKTKWLYFFPIRIESNFIMNTFLKGYYGFAFFIFQIYKEAMQSGRRVNHENIHFIQQAELLFVFQWIIYGLHYAWLRIVRQLNHRDAYRNIVFEKEAYYNRYNFEYLETRRFWSFILYFSKPIQKGKYIYT